MAADVRKGMPDVRISKDVFKSRFLEAFYDPAFEGLRPELERVMEVAWDAHEHSRKAPRTRAAGPADLDEEEATFAEVQNAAITLREAVARYRAGERAPGSTLRDPRPK